MKPVILPNERTLGTAKGSFQLICYGDYSCPASRELHFTVSQLLTSFEGKLLYAFRPFPQPQRYPYALLAARAVEAAGRQDCYWPMHYALFRYRGNIDLDGFYDLAYAMGLEPGKFHRDLEDPVLAGLVLHQVEEGRCLGVRAAPTLYIDGVLQQNTALWHLQEQLERRTTALPVGKVVGTVDPLLGAVYWGSWPGL